MKQIRENINMDMSGINARNGTQMLIIQNYIPILNSDRFTFGS